MKLQRFEDAKSFYDRVGAYLLQHEAAHNLQLRLCKTLARNWDEYGVFPYAAVVEAGQTILAVAICTPPFPLVLSQVEDRGAIALIAEDVLTTHPHLPGVNGPVDVSKMFAETWQQMTGKSFKLEMALRIHELKTVQLASTVQGQLRVATECDRELLLQWHHEFEQEALGNLAPQNGSETWVNRTLEQQSAYLWINEKPVSLACGMECSDNSAVLNMVYTPPVHRKQGYASACVAALSQHLLNQGYEQCVLFTDLANPTANKIYRAIGYQPVCDWNHFGFVN